MGSKKYPIYVTRNKLKAFPRWRAMISRCFSEGTKAYPHYGGRGITVCERWKSFDNFYEDMGEPPPGMTLDRINNDGNYEPGNCRWATMRVQANNKGNNRYLRFNGMIKSVADWASSLRINEGTIRARLRKNLPINMVLSQKRCALNSNRSYRSNNRFIELNGVKKTLSQWAEHLGISKQNIYRRLKNGWTVEEALAR